MTSVGCPVCGGAIRCSTESFSGGLKIVIDRSSAAWHAANCFSAPPPRDREIISAGDRLLLDWSDIAGRAA